MMHHHRRPNIPGMKSLAQQCAGPALPRPTPGNGCPWTRREFLKAGVGSMAFVAVGPCPGILGREKPAVSITRVKNGNVAWAVEEAIDLLGGIGSVAAGKDRIMLKPNLVAESPAFTTKPEVVRVLASLLGSAGKDVVIGEGSAAGTGFNVRGDVIYRTKNPDILDPMQQYVFDQLGYTDLARSLRVPLLNLHSGELVDVDLSNGYVFDRITLHRSLADIDLLVSVPMMKTHQLATVTLGMKNLIGLYPGTVYYSVRAWLHDHAAQVQSPGVAYEIVDMVRANKLGLTVIDGTWAMEGDGPTEGDLVEMGLILAGTEPLATDMVGAAVMGIAPQEVPTFVAAWGAGMTPTTLDDIEIRGTPLNEVRREFKRPAVLPWTDINTVWGVEVIRDSMQH